MTEARNNHGNMTDNMELAQHDRGKESPHNMTDARNHHLNMRQERIYHSNMTDTRNCRNLTMLTLFNHVKTTTWLAIPNQNRHMTDAIRKYQKHHIYVWLYETTKPTWLTIRNHYNHMTDCTEALQPHDWLLGSTRTTWLTIWKYYIHMIDYSEVL